MIYYKCKKDKREKNMRKLNELQKNMINKQFTRIGYLVIMYVEKYGNDKETLEQDIDLAYDLIQQHAE
jgi:hypothetical protein